MPATALAAKTPPEVIGSRKNNESVFNVVILLWRGLFLIGVFFFQTVRLFEYELSRIETNTKRSLGSTS
jgi:hypothetical protein